VVAAFAVGAAAPAGAAERVGCLPAHGVRPELVRRRVGKRRDAVWPSGANATATSVNLEHIVCSEWLRNGEIVRETGYARQDATICTLANQSENSERRDRPLGVFGTGGDANNAKLYNPVACSAPKRTRLALATCHGMLSYPLVQHESKAAGSKRFAGTFGVAEYSRRFDGLLQYALAPSSAIARRLALVNSAYHRWHNPLVLRPKLLRQPRFSELLGMRLRGGRGRGDDPDAME